MDVNRQNLERVREQFSRLFFEALDANENQGRQFVESLGRIVPSSASKETYMWMVRTGGLRKFEGERVLNRFKSHDLTIEADEYEDSLTIDLRDIERDRLGLHAPGIMSMAEGVFWHYAVLFTQLLESGWSNKSYDGVNFFSDAHPNPEAAPEAGLDIAEFSNQTDLELSVEAFRKMRLAPTKILDRQGRRRGIKYDTLFVPTELEEKAESLNNDEYLLKDPADPTLGSYKNPVRGQFESIVEIEYTTPSASSKYWAADSSYVNQIPPMLLQLVKSPDYSAVTNPEDFQVWNSRKQYHGIHCEHGAGYGLPHAIYGGEGTTAP
jgi:phage major head subunit gpT-like protein